MWTWKPQPGLSDRPRSRDWSQNAEVRFICPGKKSISGRSTASTRKTSFSSVDTSQKMRAPVLPSRQRASARKLMPEDRILEVHAQEDFVEKLTAARPAQALAELIWNGLDA